MKDKSVHTRNIIVRICLSMIVILIISINTTLSGQSLTGIPGYIRVPSAELYNDGTMFAGVCFLPKKHLEYSNYKYDAFAIYTGITFLPFLEINFRVTRMLDIPKSRNYTVDRMPSIRLKLLNEKKIIPSFVIGANDIAGDARNFGALYFVITKNISIPSLTFNCSIGYGTNWLKSEYNNSEFYGFFGGIKISHKEFSQISIIIDYDGYIFSSGVSIYLFNHIRILGASQGLDSFCGSFSYQFYLVKNR